MFFFFFGRRPPSPSSGPRATPTLAAFLQVCLQQHLFTKLLPLPRGPFSSKLGIRMLGSWEQMQIGGGFQRVPVCFFMESKEKQKLLGASRAILPRFPGWTQPIYLHKDLPNAPKCFLLMSASNKTSSCVTSATISVRTSVFLNVLGNLLVESWKEATQAHCIIASSLQTWRHWVHNGHTLQRDMTSLVVALRLQRVP